MAGKALSDEQNARLRVVINRLLQTRDQTTLAAELGITQPTLSAFIASKRQGSSIHVAERACSIDRQTTLNEVLGYDSQPASSNRPVASEHLPGKLAEAIRQRGSGWSAATVDELVQHSNALKEELPIAAWHQRGDAIEHGGALHGITLDDDPVAMAKAARATRKAKEKAIDEPSGSVPQLVKKKR